jgi:7-cyano-7-deazaguanine synthase in queuosine biosynthesis
MKPKKVLLYSGGLDSFIASAYLKPDMRVYVPLGHRYQEAEMKSIMRTNHVGKIHYAPGMHIGAFEKNDAEIPLRNSYLCHVATSMALREYPAANSYMIALIVQEDEMSIPDRTQEFMMNMSTLLTSLSGKNIIVESPFVHMDKTDMVHWYIENYGKSGIASLVSTHSCYSPVRSNSGFIECGNCPACFRKFVALANNDITGNFAVNPAESTTARTYLENLNKYSEKRQHRIKDAIAKKTRLFITKEITHGREKRR